MLSIVVNTWYVQEQNEADIIQCWNSDHHEKSSFTDFITFLPYLKNKELFQKRDSSY